MPVVDPDDRLGPDYDTTKVSAGGTAALLDQPSISSMPDAIGTIMRILKQSFAVLAAVIGAMCGQSARADTSGDAQFELQLTGYARQGESRSLTALQFYAEKPLPGNDVSAFVVVHRDREFRAAYVGLARKFGELQLGIGIGNAWYDDLRHPTINPWLYYGSDDAEAYLTAEHYGRDNEAPWFYKGYASRRIADSLFIGAYGEKGLGAGPMFGWRNGGVRMWIAVPAVSRPEAGARTVAGIEIAF